MADNVDADTASWKEIEVTFYVTAATAGVFLLIFEIARRRPVFRKVFDRRRAVLGEHSRTPPPLLNKAWYVPEWLFLSTDPTYIEYADFVHTETVIQERKRQQDELNRKRAVLALKADSKRKKEVDDDNDVVGFASRAVGGVSNGNIEVEEEEEIVVQPNSEDDEEGGDEMGKNKKKKKKTKRVNTVANTALTPDVMVVNGRRLHVSVVKEVEVWNLTDQQLEEYEQQLLDMELDSERRFRERYNHILHEQERRRRQKKKRGDGNNEDAIAEDLPVAVIPRSFGMGADENGSDPGVDLARIVPPPRWRYIGFTSLGGGGGRIDVFGSTTEQNTNRGSVRVAGTRGFLDGPKSLSILRVNSLSDDEEMAGGSSDDGGARIQSVSSKDSTVQEYKAKNQYLKSVSDKVTRPLSVADQELLRCVGLDAYVMLRFLRFGFDVTFYPFLVACAMLIPTYYTNDFAGDETLDTSGYFRFTFNRLEQGSVLLWVPWTYAVLFFTYFLYRLHVEWETFIALRSDFLANGDADMDSGFSDPNQSATGATEAHALADSDAAQKRVIQFRNSCLVEYIPPSHQSDQGLFEFFDAIFPSQVERAEILMKADLLTKLIAKRQKLVERYENVYAMYFHVHQKHRRRVDYLKETEGTLRHYLCCRCCRGLPKQPSEPTINLGGRCCGRKVEKILPYYLSEIEKLNSEIDAEHARISEAKRKVDENAGKKNLLSRAVGKGIQFVTGMEQYTCSTGFVEFKNLSTKQNALQCNVSGTTRFLTTASAPDPRDLNWDNAGEPIKKIRIKLRQCQILLFAGVLFWFFVVSFVTSISNLDRLSKYLPSYLIPAPDTYWYGIVQGYLPVVALELLMLLVPIALRFTATRYIRLKTNSEVDKFVFIWHFAYRLANLVIIIMNNQVLQTLGFNEIRSDFRRAVGLVAQGVAFSSQFFMNNLIAAAGTATMWELAQMPSMIVHFFTFRIITVEAKSKRALEKLEQPSSFEWGDIFPPFIFALLVGTVYAMIVPFLLGVCSVFFYLATKVYTHQALFVYVQPYEGGGKLMYLLNRTLFSMLYFSISIIALLLALKEGRYEAPTFFASMILLTLFVDWRIQTKFASPSISLNLTNARIIDNEEKVRRRQAKKRRKGKKKGDEYDSYIFRQPQMNKSLWEPKPRPYR